MTYVDELARLARTQLTDLRALEPPADDRAVYRRMLDQQQATLGVYADLRNAVRGGIPSAIESVLRRANESNRKVAEAAVELGAGACVPGEAGETATGR